MPENIAALVALCQTVITITVLIVWVHQAWRYWNRESLNFSSVSWGGALLALSIWRTSAFLDDYTLNVITTEGGWALTLIVWFFVACISVGNLIVWLRGADKG